jgi:hypothetical protein
MLYDPLRNDSLRLHEDNGRIEGHIPTIYSRTSQDCGASDRQTTTMSV